MCKGTSHWWGRGGCALRNPMLIHTHKVLKLSLSNKGQMLIVQYFKVNYLVIKLVFFS